MTASGGWEMVDLDVFGGVWAIRSESSTVYYVDADMRALLRQTGKGSSRGPADNRWVPLLRVSPLVGNAVRIGERHKYVFDFKPDGVHYGWWVQRPVTAIERVDADELAGLPPRLGRHT